MKSLIKKCVYMNIIVSKVLCAVHMTICPGKGAKSHIWIDVDWKGHLTRGDNEQVSFWTPIWTFSRPVILVQGFSTVSILSSTEVAAEKASPAPVYHWLEQCSSFVSLMVVLYPAVRRSWKEYFLLFFCPFASCSSLELWRTPGKCLSPCNWLMDCFNNHNFVGFFVQYQLWNLRFNPKFLSLN